MGSIQGKVTLYVTSETSGWGQQQRVGMDLPRVTSALVTVEQFPQYMKEKSENDYKALRDQYLVSVCTNVHCTMYVRTYVLVCWLVSASSSIGISRI